jgi:hypothetical protein
MPNGELNSIEEFVCRVRGSCESNNFGEAPHIT